MGTNKNLFFLVCFCFYWFLKGAERKSSFFVNNAGKSRFVLEMLKKNTF